MGHKNVLKLNKCKKIG